MTRLARQLASSVLRRRQRLLGMSLLMAASGCNALLGNESVSGASASQGDSTTATIPSGALGASGGSGVVQSAVGASGRAAESAAGSGHGSSGSGAAGPTSGSGGNSTDSAGGTSASAGGASAPLTCAMLQCPEHSRCDDAAPACQCEGGYELHSSVCLDADECADHSAACDAHAACTNREGGYACDCLAPYVGDGMSCTLDTSCQQQQCDANARCDAAGCMCITGYQGDGHTCTRIDPCMSQPCKNAGVCTATATGFSCDCGNTGFMGTTCQEPIDDCASKPCKNGGMCSDRVKDYACACKSGWMGKQCDTSTGCDYGGTHYTSGSSFPSGDGCNTCNCNATGAAVCTTDACTGQSCGGIAGAKCPSGQYCYFEGNCGASDQQGTCDAVPQVCNDAVQTVCGCDGKSYPNACYAARAMISVQKTGDCMAMPTGCTYNGMHYDAGASFPSQDGCNTCSCSSAGQVVCTQKACVLGCGGKTGAACTSGQYCRFDVGVCGASDGAGTCATKPDVCSDVVMQVCGCDGKTYSNACFASIAGVSVKANDACATTMLPP